MVLDTLTNLQYGYIIRRSGEVARIIAESMVNKV